MWLVSISQPPISCPCCAKGRPRKLQMCPLFWDPPLAALPLWVAMGSLPTDSSPTESARLLSIWVSTWLRGQWNIGFTIFCFELGWNAMPKYGLLVAKVPYIWSLCLAFLVCHLYTYFFGDATLALRLILRESCILIGPIGLSMGKLPKLRHLFSSPLQ